MTASKTETPQTEHVYDAMLAILGNMSVSKNGTLPGNMGGKSYITAVDASAEAKRQFVEQGLVILPAERIVKHDVVIHKDRLNVLIAVEGTYTIVSTKDNSKAVISGSGDGLATGTAVASNIASTNSLKNALLRTFLITEQSVEDAAKNGEQESNSATGRRLDSARAAAQPRQASAPKPPTTAKEQIKAEFVTPGHIDGATLNAQVEKLKGEGISGATIYEVLLERLRKGEVS